MKWCTVKILHIFFFSSVIFLFFLLFTSFLLFVLIYTQNTLSFWFVLSAAPLSNPQRFIFLSDQYWTYWYSPLFFFIFLCLQDRQCNNASFNVFHGNHIQFVFLLKEFVSFLHRFQVFNLFLSSTRKENQCFGIKSYDPLLFLVFYVHVWIWRAFFQTNPKFLVLIAKSSFDLRMGLLE